MFYHFITKYNQIHKQKTDIFQHLINSKNNNHRICLCCCRKTKINYNDIDRMAQLGNRNSSIDDNVTKIKEKQMIYSVLPFHTKQLDSEKVKVK